MGEGFSTDFRRTVLKFSEVFRVQIYQDALASPPTCTRNTGKWRKEEKESSYHNLLVGILTGNADWLVKSNVEAGEGFADIIVETDDPDAGIVAELKYTKNFDDMKMTCQKAIDQIRDRRYQEYLLNDDRKDIRLYGITFCKKRCCAISEKLWDIEACDDRAITL